LPNLFAQNPATAKATATTASIYTVASILATLAWETKTRILDIKIVQGIHTFGRMELEDFKKGFG
jgi:hypothetical protein